MVYFLTKIAIWVNFEGFCNGRRWYILWTFDLFKAIWYIWWSFGIFAVIWYTFPRFGILYKEKSGNPALKLVILKLEPTIRAWRCGTHLETFFSQIHFEYKTQRKKSKIETKCISWKKWRLQLGVARCHIFKPKIQNWVNFGGSCNGICWRKLWQTGIFYCHLVYFTAIW
jgi:hypothetical protein